MKHPNIITVDIDQPDDFAIRIDKHGRISAWGEREAIDIGAVWTRIKFPLMPIRPHFAPGLEEVVRTEWTAFASGLVHIYEKERLSGAKVYRADSKMAQLVSAARAGFLVPESIVGVGKANAEHFSEEYQEMIFKPLHASRIAHSDDLHFDILATTSLNRADLQDIDEGEFRASPYFIQQRLDNSTEHRLLLLVIRCSATNSWTVQAWLRCKTGGLWSQNSILSNQVASSGQRYQTTLTK